MKGKMATGDELWSPLSCGLRMGTGNDRWRPHSIAAHRRQATLARKWTEKRLYTLFQRQIMQNWLHLFYTLKWSHTFHAQHIDLLEGHWHGRNLKMSPNPFPLSWMVGCGPSSVVLSSTSSSSSSHHYHCLSLLCVVLSSSSISSSSSSFSASANLSPFSLASRLLLFFALFVSEQARPWWLPWAMSVFSFMLNLRQGNMPGPHTWTFSFMCVCLAALLFQSASSLAHSCIFLVPSFCPPALLK